MNALMSWLRRQRYEFILMMRGVRMIQGQRRTPCCCDRRRRRR